DLYLISPAGTRIELSTDNGGSGDNYTNTIFDDSAPLPITSGTPPFTGSFRPEQPLSTLIGENGNGTWKLEVTDDLAGFGGTLNSWSINLQTTEPNQLTPASGQYLFTPLQAGNYLLRQVPLTNAVFTHPPTGAYNLTAAAADVLNRDFGNLTAFSSATGFYVRLNSAGDRIEIFNSTTPSGTPDVSLDRATTSQLHLIAGPFDDQLIVDLVNGNPIPVNGISYDGGLNEDRVTLRGTPAAETALFNGSAIEFDGRRINYVSTESVHFEAGAGNDLLIYEGSTALPAFLGAAGQNTLRITAGATFQFDVDAATQNEVLDVEVLSAGSQAVFGATQHLGTLTVGAGALASLAAPGASLIRVSGISVDPNGALNLADGALIVDYSGGPSASPLPAIRTRLASGYAAGTWNGPGIRSSAAAGSPRLDALGYAEASQLFTTFPATFLGEVVDATTVLVRFTLAGDANFDGLVNLADFAALGASFNTAGDWFQGNFNYDGLIDLSDFALLAANFNQSLPGGAPRPSGGSLSSLPSSRPIALFSDRRIDRQTVIDDVLAGSA
ncbi:MAG: proprotein convertase P-domain-containing protein, partial [Phycisphaerae bacterium]|nr:proprotein convertase P-domain-containing protein [Phycisphaerae bacterium]MDW8263119.1 proprotein convertase P-domain-containing protein [Phycisphaerales bacterium]